MSAAIQTVTQERARAFIGKLSTSAERLEAIDDPAWYELARAAAFLEALRLGLIKVEAYGAAEPGQVSHA